MKTGDRFTTKSGRTVTIGEVHQNFAYGHFDGGPSYELWNLDGTHDSDPALTLQAATLDRGPPLALALQSPAPFHVLAGAAAVVMGAVVLVVAAAVLATMWYFGIK